METSSSTIKETGEIEGDNSKRMKINVPKEIVTDIISRLPVKPVFQLQCLSKNFASITSDCNFIEAHLRHSARLRPSIIISTHFVCYLIRSSGIDSKFTVEQVSLPKPNAEMFRMVGSCNGLVVGVIGMFNNECFLLNPSTSKYDWLPCPSGLPGRHAVSASWGFGFCAESKVYKIVRIAVHCTDISFHWSSKIPIDSRLSVEVLTYGTDSAWRELEFSKFDDICFRYVYGVTIKGVVYWRYYNNKLLAFNLEKEEFAWIFGTFSKHGKIMEFKGSLAMCDESQVNKNTFDIWVLKDENHCVDGVCHAVNENSWVKIYTTDIIPSCQPLLCVNDQLLLQTCAKNLKDSFYLYDLESKKIRQIHKLIACNKKLRAYNFVESMVPLALGGYSEYNSNEADQE